MFSIPALDYITHQTKIKKMKTLQLDEATARKLYLTADAAFKTILEQSFTKDFFTQKITDRVKTLADACKELGKDINTLFADAVSDYDKAETAIKTFAEALRQGKKPSECYYYPYFLRSSGGGFSYADYGDAHDVASVGARLRVDTPENARHLGNCMLAEYKIYLQG